MHSVVSYLPCIVMCHVSCIKYYVMSFLCMTYISRHYRSEEHTSELQSQFHLVCRLLLEKKKKKNKNETKTEIRKKQIANLSGCESAACVAMTSSHARRRKSTTS